MKIENEWMSYGLAVSRLSSTRLLGETENVAKKAMMVIQSTYAARLDRSRGLFVEAYEQAKCVK